MTNKNNAIYKLVVWIISIFVSFIPMLYVSFLSSLIIGTEFSSAFYSEFCKSSVLYISISSIVSLIFGCLIDLHFSQQEMSNLIKWLNIGWLTLSIICLLVGCLIYGGLSVENTTNQIANNSQQINSDALFNINLCIMIGFFVVGIIKHIIDILIHRKRVN